MNSRPPLESMVEQTLRNYVEKADGLCLKLPPTAKVGIPDRLVILPGGRIIFVEVKRDYGSLSRSQVECHRMLESLGCEVKVLFGEPEVFIFAKDEGLIKPRVAVCDSSSVWPPY
ncbi:hypothetical protein FACS1894184_10230 [Clostridia bacterium]|nr:hypothetical protein FACS1894184_10230 [Clostridia bacterium]